LGARLSPGCADPALRRPARVGSWSKRV
jgi:hypothetical protein